MRKLTVLFAAAAMSTCAMADITAFVAPAATGGGFSNASFTPLSATGFYGAGFGAFDNHWLLTVDGSNPLLTITVENSFNPRTGGGALNFDTMTFSGPGVAGAALTPASPPCVVGPVPADCITRRTGTFAVAAGSYDLAITGNNPFNGSYRVAVTVVPEPATLWLFALGIFGLSRGRLPCVRT